MRILLWDEIVGLLEILAVPSLIVTIIGVYAHSVYADRSKREEFRRAALYERKLAGYEEIISKSRNLAGLYAWIGRSQDIEKAVAPIVANLPPDTREEATRGFSLFFGIVRQLQFDNIVRRGGWEPQVQKLPGFKPLSEGGFLLDEVLPLFQSMEFSMRAGNELQDAVTKLKLLGCPRKILDGVATLQAFITQSYSGLGSTSAQPNIAEFESRVEVLTEDLATQMHLDLEATIGGTAARDRRPTSLESPP